MSRTIDPNKTIIQDCSGNKAEILEHNSLAVSLVDQTTRAFSTRINQQIISSPNIYIITSTVIDTYVISIYSSLEPQIGQGIALYSPIVTPPQLFFGIILNYSGTPPIWNLDVDTRLPYVFQPAATGVFTYTTEMNVNGSSPNEQIFTLTNIFQVPINITRIIPHMIDKESMDDEKFGGLPALTRGVTLRKSLLDGTYINYWNVHNNGEFRELSYDVSYVPASPAGNVGFGCRMTYAGQHKHGVAIELLPGEGIEIIIQDDLTGLESFTCMFEGHANGEG